MTEMLGKIVTVRYPDGDTRLARCIAVLQDPAHGGTPEIWPEASKDWTLLNYVNMLQESYKPGAFTYDDGRVCHIPAYFVKGVEFNWYDWVTAEETTVQKAR